MTNKQKSMSKYDEYLYEKHRYENWTKFANGTTIASVIGTVVSAVAFRIVASIFKTRSENAANAYSEFENSHPDENDPWWNEEHTDSES